NMNGSVDHSSLTTINVTTNQQIIPQFMPAKRVHFTTNPVGLRVIVDRTVIQTPSGSPQNKLPGTNIDSSCTPDWSRLPGGAPPGISVLCIGDFDFLPGSKHLIGAQVAQQDDAFRWWVFTGFSNGIPNNTYYTADGNPGNAEYIVANFAPGYPATFLTLP